MIQAVHKGIAIEMELHQLTHGYWKCDYTTIKHPERIMTIHHGNEEFGTMELARESALHEACDAIDQAERQAHTEVQPKRFGKKGT
jgi:hypothetical protein